MNNKKILFNLNTFPVAGNIVPLVKKMSFWQKSGYAVTIFASDKMIKKLTAEKSLRQFESIEIISHSETTNKFGFMFECLRRNIISLKYLKRIEAEKFSVVYTISSVLDLVLIPYILKLRKNKFIWLTVFDNLVPFTGTGNKLIRFFNWFFFKLSVWLIKKADRIFAPSSNVESYLRKKGMRSDQIVPTGNGVEVEMIKKARSREEVNVDALYIGRIHEAKGIYEMLKVLDLVSHKYPNFKLAIMGDGEAETVKNFRDKIEKMGLSPNVDFLGYKSGQEKYDIIKSSKCFWFFSESEGFPQALMEAVSSGLRCFVYDLPAYKYYQNNEIDIFKQKDHKSVADAVIDLFCKKDFNNRAGLDLLANFDWEKIAKIELDSVSQ